MFKGLINHKPCSFVSGDDTALNRLQSIIWANHSQAYRHIRAWLGLFKLAPNKDCTWNNKYFQSEMTKYVSSKQQNYHLVDT